MHRHLLLSCLLAAALPAQQVTVQPDSMVLRVGDTARVVATVRGAVTPIAFSGTDAAIFTAHRDGRVTARAPGCAFARASAGAWTAAPARAQVRVCVVAASPTPVPVPPPVSPPVLTPTQLFAADWPTLGADRAAVLSGGAWSMNGGQGLEVVPSTGLDLPMPHVLRVTAVGATSGYAFLRKTGIPVPAIGERRFYRWYFRATMPDGLEDQESHPFQDGNASSQSNWLFHVWHNRGGAGRWTPEIRASGNAWPDARWYGPVLTKGVTYRFELALHRTADSTFTLTPRIYDHRGALIAGPEAFTNEQGRTGLESTSSRIRNPAELGGLNAGLNGIAGSPTWPFVYGYQGGVAVCARDWCGPWTP